MTRHRQRLDKWQFQVDQNNIGEERGWFRPAHDTSGWMAVEAPKPWDFYHEAFWGYEGVGWYTAEIQAAGPVEPGLLQRIIFNSVSGHARIWLNGTYLGEHFSPYMPFNFLITPYLKGEGSNVIAMRVDNRHREEWLPGGATVEWIQYGGILQPVEIETSAAVSIHSVKVDPTLRDNQSAIVHCRVEISNASAQDSFTGEVTIELPGDGGGIAASAALTCGCQETVEVALVFDLPDPQLWDVDHPRLYRMQVNVQTKQTIIDQMEQRFGIRTIETVGTQIMLNGKPLLIKGVNRYDEYAGFGPSVPPAMIREDLLKIKSMGANLVRFHYPQSEVHLDIMDELGLLHFAEVPLNWWLSEWGGDRPYIPEVIDKAEVVLEEMIKRDYNHPCVIVWSMCNESGTNTEHGIAAMRRLIQRTRELDKSRLTTFVTTGSDGHAAFDEADLVCVNLYYGVFFHRKLAYEIAELDEVVRIPTEEHLRKTAADYPNKPVIMAEFGTHGIFGLSGKDRFSETYQAAYLESVWQAIVGARIQGGVLWCWADYYHRRDFFNTEGLMWQAPYGPFGIVTIDRKEKEGFHTLSRLFNSTV
ncbi:hypothetical protein EBB07_16695 [Paenibacillaceae bacterium]|nr:hypothetical protein EBB07_16695 [Paenibacillaceae bacterium]